MSLGFEQGGNLVPAPSPVPCASDQNERRQPILPRTWLLLTCNKRHTRNVPRLLAERRNGCVLSTSFGSSTRARTAECCTRPTIAKRPSPKENSKHLSRPGAARRGVFSIGSGIDPVLVSSRKPRHWPCTAAPPQVQVKASSCPVSMTLKVITIRWVATGHRRALQDSSPLLNRPSGARRQHPIPPRRTPAALSTSSAACSGNAC
jgi:hypothetical protein